MGCTIWAPQPSRYLLVRGVDGGQIALGHYVHEVKYIIIVPRVAEDVATPWHAILAETLKKNFQQPRGVFLTGRNDVPVRSQDFARPHFTRFAHWDLSHPSLSRRRLIPVISWLISTRTLPWRGRSVGERDFVHGLVYWIICKRSDIVSRAVQTFWRVLME